MPEKFINCVREVSKKINKGEMPKGSNAYAICRVSTGYYGTTHNIGMIHKIKKQGGK